MTVNVNFKINPETKLLDIALVGEDGSTEHELNMAKRVLSLATQLHFVDFPKSVGIDVGASIVVSEEVDNDESWDEEEFFEGDEGYYHDSPTQFINDDADELTASVIHKSTPVEQLTRSVDDVIDFVTSEDDVVPVEINCSKTKKQIEDMLSKGESIGWKNGDDYLQFSLDIDDAKEVIGGLTTPSVIATMMVYELLKKTIYKVEKYV